MGIKVDKDIVAIGLTALRTSKIILPMDNQIQNSNFPKFSDTRGAV